MLCGTMDLQEARGWAVFERKSLILIARAESGYLRTGLVAQSVWSSAPSICRDDMSQI